MPNIDQGPLATQTTSNGHALDRLRILDLTQVAAGPYATMLLGLMGAEVIKVESCSRMDIKRGRARPEPGDTRVYPGGEPGERPWNRAAHHIHRNINKLSVTLDLGTPGAKNYFLSWSGFAMCWSKTTVGPSWTGWASATKRFPRPIHSWST